MLDGDWVEGVFTIDRSYVGNPNNETYMVIYTTQATLSQTTQAMSPSKMMAKSLSVQDYGAEDPLIPHSAWGVVKIDVEDMSASALGITSTSRFTRKRLMLIHRLWMRP